MSSNLVSKVLYGGIWDFGLNSIYSTAFSHSFTPKNILCKDLRVKVAPETATIITKRQGSFSFLGEDNMIFVGLDFHLFENFFYFLFYIGKNNCSGMLSNRPSPVDPLQNIHPNPSPKFQTNNTLEIEPYNLPRKMKKLTTWTYPNSWIFFSNRYNLSLY